MKYFLGNVLISKVNNNNNMVLVLMMMMMVYININININGVNAINVGGKEEIIKVPALLVFGDSIVDPGNNNYLHTIGRANFPPYGRDFPHSLPTGRYSNGKVPSDFFAEELGIKELVPPYLDPKLEISELLTGVSFASGAAGYNPKSAKLANVLSLDDQLDLFKEYIQKLKDSVGENRTSTIVSESIYLVCAGSNDITNIYFTLPLTRLEYDVNTYTSLMLDWGSSFLEKLYGLGARRIGVISAPPCGCLPSQRLLHTGLSRSCAQNENQAAILFNDKLSTQLNYLNQHLPQSRFVYLDIYNIILQLVTNPSQYGFEVADRGCCGTGNLEVSFLCNKLDPGTCKDASKYVFWDSFHPTQAAYQLIVHQVLQKSLPHFF